MLHRKLYRGGNELHEKVYSNYITLTVELWLIYLIYKLSAVSSRYLRVGDICCFSWILKNISCRETSARRFTTRYICYITFLRPRKKINQINKDISYLVVRARFSSEKTASKWKFLRRVIVPDRPTDIRVPLFREIGKEKELSIDSLFPWHWGYKRIRMFSGNRVFLIELYGLSCSRWYARNRTHRRLPSTFRPSRSNHLQRPRNRECHLQNNIWHVKLRSVLCTEIFFDDSIIWAMPH